MQQASTLALASLGTVLATTVACQDLTGQCSNRTDTLCLQIDVADRNTIPDDVQLTLSGGNQSPSFDFPNIAAQLAARPYVAEVVFDTTAPATLKIAAVGNITDPATQTKRQVSAASLSVNPLTAARPTRIVLQDTGGSGNDLAAPSGDMSGGSPPDFAAPADLQGAPWTVVYSAPGTPLNGIFGNNAGMTKIYAVGNKGFVVRGDGTNFAPVTATGSANLSSVWVATGMEAFACDQTGGVFHSTDGGTTWVSNNTATFALNRIFGRSSADVFAVGNDPAKGLWWNGTAWQLASYNLGASMTGVFASTAYYYIIGGSGIGGRAAMPMTVWGSLTNGNNASQWALAGLGTTDTFTVAVSNTGVAQYLMGMVSTTWTNMSFPNGTALSAVWVPAANNAIVGGANGTAYQYSSGTWTSISNGNLTGYTITGLWGDGGNGLWASAVKGTDGAIFKR